MMEGSMDDTGLRCPRCGYNLTAMTSSVCPECGERFVVTNREGYLAKVPPSRVRRLCGVMWLMGTVVIVLSWVNVVPAWVGWIGFGVAGVGWLVSLVVRR
ncbi:MAG TPA: hypothetical protein VH253_01265 [Phycisphaerae bacterium]|nr:hypothetical protein [Phycisphaerae bacterium]